MNPWQKKGSLCLHITTEICSNFAISLFSSSSVSPFSISNQMSFLGRALGQLVNRWMTDKVANSSAMRKTAKVAVKGVRGLKDGAKVVGFGPFGVSRRRERKREWLRRTRNSLLRRSGEY